MTDSSSDTIVREFLLAWERRDTDQIMSFCTDDAVWHIPSMDPIVGKPAIREFVTSYEGVPPGRFEIGHQLASESVVMNERTDHFSVNGREIAVPICGVFEIDAGRIKAWRDYYNASPRNGP
jgi:limonene-1,2-epoxide hydrolase